MKNPPINRKVNIIESKLKYISIKAFMESPKKKMRVATAKNRNDRPIAEATKNSIKSAETAPAVIVKTLYGMGVKAAASTVKKL